MNKQLFIVFIVAGVVGPATYLGMMAAWPRFSDSTFLDAVLYYIVPAHPFGLYQESFGQIPAFLLVIIANVTLFICFATSIKLLPTRFVLTIIATAICWAAMFRSGYSIKFVEWQALGVAMIFYSLLALIGNRIVKNGRNQGAK